MPRQSPDDAITPELLLLLDRLAETGADQPSVREQIHILETARDLSPEAQPHVDRWLVQQLHTLKRGIDEAARNHAELKALHERLTSPPWFVAVFLRRVDATDDKALVVYQGSPRAVTAGDGVSLDEFAPGDDVLLTQDLNVLMQRLTPPVTRASEVAEFQYALPDGRLVLKMHEAEVIVRATGTLATSSLKCGDRVRWDSALAFAFERLPKSEHSAHTLDDMPTESFADIGGLDDQVARLQRGIRLHMRHPDLARRYGLRAATSVLLVGPPGTGKTMVARALARWLGLESSSGRARFMHIKPGALHSMWYAQSEANYREVFRVARETAARHPGEPVVLFFDEVDAIGLSRGGGSIAHVDDRVLTSFMAELDGLEARGNVLVVAATNRRGALDPALLRPGRLGDLVLEIPRPGMAAARAILERHIPASMPCGEATTRATLIDTVLSRLYAPNAESAVATIAFRDGTTRPVLARELVSGAFLANLARASAERGCARELAEGVIGVTMADVLDAVDEELGNAASALTPANCHAHLDGLPQDLAVVRVESSLRKPRRPHRFVTAA